MVIDFHTHVFPDKIASKTIEALERAASVAKAHTDGTLKGLLESMRLSGIDRSVILPVATRKGQFDTINRFALEINEKYPNLLSFGGIHPDDDDIEGKTAYLKDKGFRGIKIHPDYTGVFIDDERYINIISSAARNGMLTVTHAGVDPAFDVIHCPPEKARRVIDRIFKETGVKKPFLVLAHLGGMMVHKEVEKYLLGTECYIDISSSFSEVNEFCDTTGEDVVNVIRRHGADKILFATDSPWFDQKIHLEHFRSLKGISDREKDMILYENAQRLLSWS